MLVMESHMPHEMGNMIMLFGILLSLGIFFGFGITQNMWGGFEFQPEGSIFSLVILFFAVLTGLNFRHQEASSLKPKNDKTGLTDQDRELVMSALKKSQSFSSGNDEPKVIVVKQESPSLTEKSKDDKKEPPLQAPANDSHGMGQNPYFAYPPDFYYDEDEEDEYEDEYEDEWEDEWEDEDDE